MYAFLSQVVSRKLSFLPQLQSLCDLEQLLQVGLVSSHLRWRSLQVKQPVRVRFGFPSGVASPSRFLGTAGLAPGEGSLGGGVTVEAMPSLIGDVVGSQSPGQAVSTLATGVVRPEGNFGVG